MDFASWLEGELNTREWTQADLARKGGLTTAQVSRIMARQQNPGQVFIEGVAKALGLPVAVVYQHAGLLPTNQRESTKVKVLLHIAEQLDEDDVEELIEIARLRNRRKGTANVKKATT